MMLKMDAAKFVPGDCHASWKRGQEVWDGMDGSNIGREEMVEMIDMVEYPMLPQGLLPW
jgi:hypothetical protein